MKNADMPAMPLGAATVSLDSTDEAARGLTKREHLAAMAMQGIVSSKTMIEPNDIRIAVRIADALLSALENS